MDLQIHGSINYTCLPVRKKNVSFSELIVTSRDAVKIKLKKKKKRNTDEIKIRKSRRIPRKFQPFTIRRSTSDKHQRSAYPPLKASLAGGSRRRNSGRSTGGGGPTTAPHVVELVEFLKNEGSGSVVSVIESTIRSSNQRAFSTSSLFPRLCFNGEVQALQGYATSLRPCDFPPTAFLGESAARRRMVSRRGGALVRFQSDSESAAALSLRQETISGAISERNDAEERSRKRGERWARSSGR
ncbi:hypothetical protein PUN28_019817 [Cardiocondyla obscurior]|uniref:Uncharacterized protein n=1 Tax=Cardiocondyla obscurior TaxID=286306 RepID=A0AAW2EBR6_9HYME